MVRLPPGSRDVLPDEARELRAIKDALRTTFEDPGYGEVITPTLEYTDDVLARGVLGDALPSYRLVDDHGAWLELRSDATVPLARVAATRFHGHDGPLRFWYSQTVYRPVPQLQGRSREISQPAWSSSASRAPAVTARSSGSSRRASPRSASARPGCSSATPA